MSPPITATVTIFGLLIAAATAATGYTNYTVGGTNGWFFNTTTNTSAANYSSWAAGQTFNLGDYLVFNTNSNQTVIQTYNQTNFLDCISITDASDNETFQYDGGSSSFGQTLTIAVPLTIEGTNYYYSDTDDGVQCQHGLAFEINVKHGLGLPPSLNQPPPPPYIEPPGPDTAQSPSDTVAGAAQQPKDDAFAALANFRLPIFGFVAVLIFFH